MTSFMDGVGPTLSSPILLMLNVGVWNFFVLPSLAGLDSTKRTISKKTLTSTQIEVVAARIFLVAGSFMVTFGGLSGLLAFALLLCLGLQLAILTPSLVTKNSASGATLKHNNAFADIPGPALARWTRLWLIKCLISGKADQCLVQANKKYGPITRIGPKHVIISDPHCIRAVLGVGSKYTRGPWFDTVRLNPIKSSVAAERTLAKHKSLRHVLSPSMSGPYTLQLQSAIDRHIQGWIELIGAKYVSDGTEAMDFDLSESTKLLTLDLTVQTALGISLDFVKQGKEPYGFFKEIRIGMMAQQYISIFTEICGLRHFLAKTMPSESFLFPSRNDKEGIGKFMDVIHKALELRNVNSGTKVQPQKSMVDSWFKGGLTEEDVVYELVEVIAAGVFTTSNAVQGIILGIISHPCVYLKLQKEIDEVLVTQHVEFPVQDSVAKKLPYLQACIYEGIRRFAPLFFLLDHQVPPGGAELHSYHLPAGTLVSFNMVAVQDDEIYGHDADHYRPERWLTGDEEHFRLMRRTAELVFGDGPTKCLGRNFAYMELNKMVFELFRNFDVSMKNMEKPWKRVYRGVYDMSEFKVRVERRR